jgi:hypothetical protein
MGEELPLASVRCIAEATRTSATTIGYILTKVLGLRFHQWRWASRLMSSNQKSNGARRALLFLATLTTAEKRRGVNFWASDESWIMDDNW